MKYIVFSDVDGTLLNDNHELTNKTKEAILKLQNNNIPFVIVTSRPAIGVHPFLEYYKIKCPIISCGGSYIVDENKKELFSKTFSKELANKVIKFIEQANYDVSINIYSYNEWYAPNKEDLRTIEEENIIHAKSKYGNVNSCKKDIHKFLIICNKEDIDNIQNNLTNEFKELKITRSSNTLIEVMNKDVNKAKGVEIYSKLFNYKKENTIAFGDNYNDLEMLNYVSLPYLMDNAPDELKTIIKNKTKDNNHDGIYHALLELGLLN